MLILGPNTKNRKNISMNFELFMGVHKIEKTNNYKYLGLLIDENLNWDLQTKTLCSKLSSVCGVLSKVRHYLDRKSLMLIYNSLFDSRLRYGILGWGTTSNKNLSKIRVLQNRAVRFITFSSFRTSAAPLYSSLKILPLNEQLFLQRSIFMHSFHYKNLPYVFDTFCKQPEHRYPTRYATSNNYTLPKSVTNRGQSSIKYAGPKAWADVPAEIKEIAFRKPFSGKLKEHILGMIFEDLPPRETTPTLENSDMNFDLQTLFSTEEEGEFFGFENLNENLTTSTNELGSRSASNEEHEFVSLETTVNLSSIFFSENSLNGTFFGF